MAQSHGKPKNYNVNYKPAGFHMMPQDLKVGQDVYGEYFGALFAGIVQSRQVTDQYNTNYYVALNKPIVTALGITEYIVFSSNVRDEHSNQLSNHWIAGA